MANGVVRKGPYNDDEITRGLLTLAFTRSPKEAADLLKAQGEISPTWQTLAKWRDKYQDRYVALIEKHRDEIEKVLVTEQLDLAREATQAAREAMQLERTRIADGSVKDAAASGRNLITIAAVAIDKIMILEGRPTDNIAVRTPEQALRNLAQFGRYIEGTAEDVT